MKKSKKGLPEIEIISYGIYSKWDRASSALPEFQELTDQIKAEVDIEFGMIVEIRKSKGTYLSWRIDHPPFKGENGKVLPAFEDSFRVKQNPYRFFLGDTLWEPLIDMLGEWKLSIYYEDELLISKTLFIHQ